MDQDALTCQQRQQMAAVRKESLVHPNIAASCIAFALERSEDARRPYAASSGLGVVQTGRRGPRSFREENALKHELILDARRVRQSIIGLEI